MITSNLEDFGKPQLQTLVLLLTEMMFQCLPTEFELDLVKFWYNKSTGQTYLENAQKQKVMMFAKQAKLYYECPSCHKKGFAHDFLTTRGSIVAELNGCCITHLKNLAVIGFDGTNYTQLGG